MRLRILRIFQVEIDRYIFIYTLNRDAYWIGYFQKIFLTILTLFIGDFLKYGGHHSLNQSVAIKKTCQNRT